MKKKVSLIFGTRPEAVKLCPVARAVEKHPDLQSHVCVTAQHRQMLDQALAVFGVKPDADLDLMQPGQTLASLTARAVAAVDGYLAEQKPDLVLVQGDTTTVFAAALAAFYRQIPVGHVEAGLRTGNKFSPFPEEINRVLTGRLADLHFAPTAQAQENLLREDVPADRIFVTGNTGIDALKWVAAKVRRMKSLSIPGLSQELFRDKERPLVLITGHRRESFGAGFESICQAVARLSRRFPEAAFVYPVHLNPNVREPVFRLLGKRKNVFLIEPLAYLEFVALMDRSALLLTDSGGVQEEAPSLGKPVLVMRETTERPEGIAAGSARLVGTDVEKIVGGVTELLRNRTMYEVMAHTVNPYGDGKSSGRIANLCAEFLQGRA
jgi:UDP-N-acetylglucosamine 2-epimerase (non-hydrolysing)